MYKHFTERDVFTRWDVLNAYYQATAQAATLFPDSLLKRAPFPVRTIEVDGGSEFKAQFEAACQQRGIHLFPLPPRSPKMNAHAERAQRTHKEEFYRMLSPDSLSQNEYTA